MRISELPVNEFKQPKIMNNYEITHKGIKYKAQGSVLVETMIGWCIEKGFNVNEIESCVLIPKKEVKPIRGLSNTLISDLSIKYDKSCTQHLESYEITLNIISMNEKGSKNINKFLEKLINKQRSK